MKFLKETGIVTIFVFLVCYVIWCIYQASFDLSQFTIKARESLATTLGFCFLIILIIQFYRYIDWE
jgi:hypothetical protein